MLSMKPKMTDATLHVISSDVKGVEIPASSRHGGEVGGSVDCGVLNKTPRA